MISEALGRMAHNLTAAADTLVSLLGDENPLVRLRAATALLEITPKLWNDVDVAARLDELERQVVEQRVGA
jgi:HEAT repeat protein